MSEKKNIVFFLNSLNPAGGIERVTVGLINELAKFFSVTIIVKDELPSFYPLHESVRLISLKNKISLNMKSRVSRIFSILRSCFRTTYLIRLFLKKDKFDCVVICHPMNLLEVRLAGVRGKNIIATEHGAHTGYNIVYRLMKEILYKDIKAYIVPTQSDYLYYKRKSYPVRFIQHLKPKLNYKNANLESRKVLNIGRFTEDKQQLKLLKVWREISRRFSNWVLVLVGCGELEELLRQFVDENSLNDNVVFLPPQKNVEELYEETAIFCLTSKFEGFGMVLLEAQGFGIPCLAFDCPVGPRDIIRDSENGFLIPLNDLDSYRENLEKLMSDSHLIEKMALRSKEFSDSWNNGEIVNTWRELFLGSSVEPGEQA